MKRYRSRFSLYLALVIAGGLFFPGSAQILLAGGANSTGFFEGLKDTTTDIFGLDPRKDLKKALSRSSSEWENTILLAERADWAFSYQYKIVQNCFTQRKCQEIAEKIIKQTPYPDFRIQVKIIDSTTANAFTTGGRYIYIYSGLLLVTETEDAVAFIIAHEIGHIMAEHGKRKEKGEAWGNLMVILTKPKNSQDFNAIKKLVNANYSKDFEREADVLGAIFAYRAGYNVEDGAKYFLGEWKKQEQYKQQLLLTGNTAAYRDNAIYEMFFADHPPMPERIALLRQTQRVMDGNEKTHPLAYVFFVLDEMGLLSNNDSSENSEKQASEQLSQEEALRILLYLMNTNRK